MGENRPAPFAVRIPEATVARVRATVEGVKWTLRREYTIREFVTAALEDAIARAEREYNDGKPWPVKKESKR